MQLTHYWDEEELPDYLGEPLATFRQHNPEMRQAVFSERTAVELIGEHFGAREVAAFRACAVPTMQADYFRYCAVYIYGGVYADVGFRCIAPLRSLLTGVKDGLLVRRDPRRYILNGFFSFRAPAHPLLRLAIELATTNIERRPAEMVQMVTGPWIFSGLYLLYELSQGRDLGGRDGLEPLVERFRREASTLPPTSSGRSAVDSMVEPLFDVVGNHARLADAFHGVQVVPFKTMCEYVEAQDSLPYKKGERDWINWQRRGQTIYR